MQRTDPTKSGLSAPVKVNISSMYRASCPLAARGIWCFFEHGAVFHQAGRSPTRSDPVRLRMAAAGASPPSWRTGKRASWTGGLAPWAK